MIQIPLTSAITMRFIIYLLVALPPFTAAYGQLPAGSDRSSAAWTADAAIKRLREHPNDPYLHYVAMHLSQNREEASQLQDLMPPEIDPRFGFQRNSRINLYSIFSGSLAVQESLQLDTLTGNRSADSGRPSVAIDDLTGPTVKSHPWAEMLAGQEPEVSRLAQCVPQDHLFVRCESVSKLLAMRDLVDESYAYAAGQATGAIRSAGAIAGLKKQWMVETSGLLEPLYDTAFGEVAIASSDLFFREGTDATLIMRLKQPAVVRTALDQVLKVMAQQNPEATLQTGEFLGVAYTHVTTPDRSFHVYAADPIDDIHIRSNSQVGFETIVRTILNKPVADSTINRMSDSDEFKYIRTLMPLGADQEDGFVYMSDPFIRRLIGPEKKLTQRNRLVCRSHLQMIRHAQLFYLTQHGQDAKSIDELQSGGCLGNEEMPIKLSCPAGGEYSLTSSRGGCVCSHHGHPDAMVPCSEIPVKSVPGSQAQEYQQFVQAYSRYWQTFFDPIAVRIQVQPDKLRMETIVLPLINNSIYTGLASVLGGDPESLDSLPIPDSNIATLSLKLNKHQLLKQAGISRPALEEGQDATEEKEAEPTPQFVARQTATSLRRIGIALHNHHAAYRQNPPRPPIGKDLSPARQLSWRVYILPFLEEHELFQKFRMDEPWDSEHNLALVKEMPSVYAVGTSDVAKEGKTRFVFPQHADAMYRGPEEAAKFRDVLDGLSNTIMAIVTDEDHAVTWTKPDDLSIDLEKPRRGWATGEDAAVVLMGDGATALIPPEQDNALVAALITRNGREVIDFQLETAPAGPMGGRRGGYSHLFHREREVLIDELSLDRFLYHGIGNQIAIHVCDDQPLVDVNVSRVAGLFTSFGGRGGFISSEMSLIGVMALAVNTPLYLSVPVKDAKIVDDTLEKLDRFLVKVSQTSTRGGMPFFQIEQDAYQVTGIADLPVRAYAFRFGPVTWRFYWMRIDDGLYITSTPELIGELRAAAARRRQATAHTDDTDPAHGLIRVRPEHWQEIKPHFRIGWSESERRSCLHNLAPLSHAGRALVQSANGQADAKATIDNVRRMADQFFTGPHRCPSHGHYVLDSDTGEVQCDLHGHAAHPKQPPPNGKGQIANFAESLRDVRMELTFLKDGLHAVVTVKRAQ
jgi:hypothetical protein